MSSPQQPASDQRRRSRVLRVLDGAEVPSLYHPASRGAVMHGNLSLLAGQPKSLVLYLVLLLGAGIDLATFYQVLAKVLSEAETWVIWVGVVGFTVTALTLAHMFGGQLRQHVAAHRPARTSLVSWVCVIVWLFVGVTAFVIRLLANDAGQSEYVVDGRPVALDDAGSSFGTALLPALLFLSLYVATGMVAAIAGYTRHHPDARQYGKAVEARTRRARSNADSVADLSRASQTWDKLRDRRARVEQGIQLAEADCEAQAEQLKQHVRIVLWSRGGQHPPPEPDSR